MVRVGDKVSVVLGLGVHRAKVALLGPDGFVAIPLYHFMHRYPNGVVLTPGGEGVSWCRGHEGPAVNAFKTVVVLRSA